MQDSKGNTALHYATGYGRSALVRQLLEAGSKPAMENGAGQLPLDLISCAVFLDTFQTGTPQVVFIWALCFTTGCSGCRSEPRNPINKDKETMAMLEHAMMHQMEHEGA